MHNIGTYLTAALLGCVGSTAKTYTLITFYDYTRFINALAVLAERVRVLSVQHSSPIPLAMQPGAEGEASFSI